MGCQVILCAAQLHSRFGAAPNEQAVQPKDINLRECIGIWQVGDQRELERKKISFSGARFP